VFLAFNSLNMKEKVEMALTRAGFEEIRKRIEALILELADYEIGVNIIYDRDKREITFNYFDLGKENV